MSTGDQPPGPPTPDHDRPAQAVPRQEPPTAPMPPGDRPTVGMPATGPSTGDAPTSAMPTSGSPASGAPAPGAPPTGTTGPMSVPPGGGPPVSGQPMFGPPGAEQTGSFVRGPAGGEQTGGFVPYQLGQDSPDPGYLPPVGAPPQRGRAASLWLHPATVVGVIGLLVLLIVALVFVALNRPAATPGADQKQPSASAAPGDSSTPAADDAGAATTNPGTGDNSSPSSSAAADADQYMAGDITLDAGEEQEYSYAADLDTGEVVSYNVSSEPATDIQVTPNSLAGINGGTLALWEQTTPPTSDDCSALPGKAYSTSVHMSRLDEGAMLCVKTNDGRFGFLRVTSADKEDDGQLSGLDLHYEVWKKKGDQ